jgi:hypothetical protein
MTSLLQRSQPWRSAVQLKLSAIDGELMLLTTHSGEAALFAYNRSLDYVAAVIHLANVLELENVQSEAGKAAANIAMLKQE